MVCFHDLYQITGRYWTIIWTHPVEDFRRRAERNIRDDFSTNGSIARVKVRGGEEPKIGQKRSMTDAIAPRSGSLFMTGAATCRYNVWHIVSRPIISMKVDRRNIFFLFSGLGEKRRL
jgi:hypothetical protein